MTLRVLHFASGDGWGGAERVIETLVDATRSRIAIEALLLNEGRLAETLRGLDIPIHVIPEQARSFSRLVRDVRAFLETRRPEVIHCHRYKELLLTVLATGTRRQPVVVTIHGLEPRHQLTIRQFVTVWGCLLLARWWGRATFTAVSPELRARLAGWPLAARAREIPNPIPDVPLPENPIDLRARFGWPPTDRLVGFIGRLETVKGPDLLLEIARQTPADQRFVIVGSGSLEAELREQVGRFGLTDRVAFLGMVAQAASLLHQLDVLAIPSRHEGTPMALLEAAACGVPVVAFGVGGLPVLLEKAPRPWCVAPGDIRAFADAIAAIADDPAGARRAAREWAASIQLRYARESVAEAYVSTYCAARDEAGRRPRKATERGREEADS